MRLESPLLALVAGVVALVVLYVLDRLRRRPVILLVASLELFPKTADVESQAEQTKKRAWRDLVLRGLAALALALAAGGPSLPHARSAGRRVRVLVDRSASLEAKEQGTTRLELARAELARALAVLAPEDEVELHLDPQSDDEPTRPLTPAEARAFVPAILRVPSTIEQRIDLVAAAASAKTAPLLVVTDRDVALVDSKADPELARWLEVAVVGTPRANKGITALASRRGADGVESLLVATSEPARVELRLGAKVVTLPVDGSAVAPVPSGVERVEARLVDGADDALATDDRATALRRVDAPLRVVVDPKLGRPLEAALRAIPGADVHAGEEHEGADVYFRRWSPRESYEALRGFTVYFGEGDTEPTGDVTFQGEPRGDPIPVTKFQRDVPKDLGDLAPRATDAAKHVVIAVGARTAWVGFAPPEHPGRGWAAQDSFPRFFAYLLEEVRALEPEDLACHPTGRPLVVPRPSDARPDARLVVTDPLGRARPVEKTFTPTEPGVHEVRAEGGTKKVLFAAALLDAATSDLSRTRGRPFSQQLLATLSARPAARADATLAWLLAVLALVLAGVAWWLDNR